MKTKLIISCLMLILALSFTFTRSSNDRVEVNIESAGHAPPLPPLSSQDTTFLIGALNDGADYGFTRLDELGFNAWHTYTSLHEGWIWNNAPNDLLDADSSEYVQEVQDVLETIESHDMKSIMMRPKIAWLCYGQRSDYQCEEIPSDHDLWFYSFQSPEHTGTDADDIWQGDTQRVRYMDHNFDDEGQVVSRLKANSEQCHTWSFEGPGTDITKWVVKPRIRIDSTVADNPANWNTNVCRIIVFDSTGTGTLKDVNIKVSDFMDGPNYDGRYLEEYNFSGGVNLNITGPWGPSRYGYFGARGNNPSDGEFKVDIQVYWYGNFDMWIDYVRVDNLVANDLLSTDTTNQNYKLYEKWLRWEARDIGCHGTSPIKYYIELFAFANIPCMTYVNRKVNHLNGLFCAF